MIKNPKNKQKTVAEKITESLLHSDESGSDSGSDDEATKARVIEYDYDDYVLPQARATEFKKRNIKLLSEQSAKYKGKLSSRKDFESENDEDENSNEEVGEYENSDSSEDEAFKSFNMAIKKELSASAGKRDKNSERDIDKAEGSDFENIDEEYCEDGEDYDDEYSEDEDCDDEYGDIDSEENEDEDVNTDVISEVNHEAEIQKGLCVQNQLRIWERLLELRINLQRVVNKANQLPPPQELNELESNNTKYRDVQQTMCKQTCQLLQSLLLLQNNLSNQFPELEKAMKPSLKRPSPFNDYNAGEPPIKKVGQYLQEGFENFRGYRNSILLKWDDRIKILQPGAGNKKKTLTEEYDIIKKIDNALINKTLLKEKCQQLKNNTGELVNQVENPRNPNIYDDSDFYHQQLRELIEHKTNTSSSMGEVTNQLMELQKLRQKMKKNVDTRASKGRKLRYIVHNKLINFMAPHDNTTWTMESVDELSKSLFV